MEGQDSVLKVMRWIGRFILTQFGSVILIGALALASVALLIGGILGSSTRPEDTDYYKTIKPYWETYQKDQMTVMLDMKDKLIEENTYYIPPTEVGAEGKHCCDITVSVSQNYVSMAYFYAYITAMQDDPKYMDGRYQPKKSEVINFLDAINEIETKQDGGNYFISNKILSPDEIKALFFPEDDATQDFYETSLKNYMEFFADADAGIDTGDLGSDTNTGIGDLEFAANGMPIPLYLQYKDPWGGMAYGSSTIKVSGCAPTSLAMVISYLKGASVTPADIVGWTGGRYYITGVGSSWNIFPDVAAHYGFSCSNLGTDRQAMVTALSEGRPVIASMRPGTFTTTGHFIVLRGITEAGNILVNDPADTKNKDFINREFPLSTIIRESKNFWSFGG